MNTRNRMIDRAWKMLPEETLCRMYLEFTSKATQIPQSFLIGKSKLDEGPVKSIETPDRAFGYWLNESHKWSERKKLCVQKTDKSY